MYYFKYQAQKNYLVVFTLFLIPSYIQEDGQDGDHVWSLQ